METTITGNVYPIEGEPTVIPLYWGFFRTDRGVDTYNPVQLYFASGSSSTITFKVTPISPDSTVSLSVASEVGATYSLDGTAYKSGDTYAFSFDKLVNDFNLTEGTNAIPLILKIDGVERRFLIYKYMALHLAQVFDDKVPS
jgi:hypothetical protein